MVVGSFSVISLAQTPLKLAAGGTEASGNLKPKEEINYKIDLAKQTRICVETKTTLSDLTVTFDGKNVTPNQPNNCFDLTETRSYLIKLNNPSKDSGEFAVGLFSSNILKMEAGRVISTGTLKASEVKIFKIDLDAGKKVCVAAKSPDLSNLKVTIDSTNVELSPQPTCLGPTEARTYTITVINQTTDAGNYSFLIRYQ